MNNCKVLEEGSVFYSKSTGERYTIRQNIDCRSKNVIYLVNCKKCRMQGVGKSEDFKTRISNYIFTHYSIESNLWYCQAFYRDGRAFS